MRTMGLILSLFLLSMAVCQAETDSFRFESSGYKFESVVEGDKLIMTWHKSGFINRHEAVMKPCWKKAIKREVASIGKKLLSPRGKQQFGRPVEVKWNKWNDSRYVFPRQMDELDKRFGFLYGMGKSSELKCE